MFWHQHTEYEKKMQAQNSDTKTYNALSDDLPPMAKG